MILKECQLLAVLSSRSSVSCSRCCFCYGTSVDTKTHTLTVYSQFILHSLYIIVRRPSLTQGCRADDDDNDDDDNDDV